MSCGYGAYLCFGNLENQAAKGEMAEEGYLASAGFIMDYGPESRSSPNIFIFPPYSHGRGFIMARFKEADARLLNKMICMNCYARNAPKATRCRKCGYTNLRAKAKESRKA
jgi:large subunit ribosomal protein L40e